MDWHFFTNNGGQESGFHDAGVETFKGNLEWYLAREIIQNSLDARDDQKSPVVVKFQLLEFSSTEIPDLKGLASTFKRCSDYLTKDIKAKEFFDRAESLARAKKITALKVSDYNTKGVTGGDNDRDDGWYNLIRCSGSSSKWAGEGGSFGIGKNAPFATSRMRTVLYSTVTKDKTQAFQGVARLVSFNLPKSSGGGIAQSVGYLGGKKGASVRAKKDIPAIFGRTKPGTDLIILGYGDEGSWKDDLVRSVLENFWPAIEFGDLEADVAGTKINKKTLKQHLETFSGQEGFDAHLYYRAYVSKEAIQITGDLPTLKKVSVHLLTSEQEMPKKVAMVRKTGMVIYYKPFRSFIPYCGVFLCRNRDGNALLREMEPPRHDDWNPDHPDKKAHQKTFSEFTNFIRECVQNLAPADKEKTISIPELSQWLPDDEDSTEESFDGMEASKRESFQRQPEPEKINGRAMDRNRRPVQPDQTKPGDGDMDTEDGGPSTGAGQGGGGGEVTIKPGEGFGGGGGNGTGKAGPNSGEGVGKNAKPAIPIRSRVYASNLAGGVYTVIATPLNPVKGDVLLSLKAIGDDATTSAISVSSAKNEQGEILLIPKMGVIGPVRFKGKNRLLLTVTLAEPRKLAMEVEAHEAEQ